MTIEEENKKLEALIEKLQALQSLGIEVDAKGIENAEQAMEQLAIAQEQINNSAELTTAEYERADELMKSSIGTLSNMSNINQKMFVKLREQNKEREKANKLEQQRMETLKKISKLVIEQNKEFDKAQATLNKTTTTTGQFNSALLDVTIESRVVGATAADVSKNFSTLFNSFTGFSRMTIEQQKSLTSFGTSLDKAGFDIQSFSQFLDVGTKSMGMSVDEVKDFSSSLVSFGQKAGISAQRLSKDLAAVGPKLAVFGKDKGQRIFKEMSLAAKNLGMSMDSMFNIVEKFTTFEGAAGAAGRLNSALGGNFINSVELMQASLNDPMDTFRLLKQSMDDSGKSFDEMSPAMKRFIAETAGFNDVSEAARIFSQDMDEASASIEAQAKTQEELNKIAQSFIPIADKMKTFVAGLAPIFNGLAGAISSVLDVLIAITNFDGAEIVKSFSFISFVIVFGLVAALRKVGNVWGWLVEKFSSLTGKILKPFGKVGEAIKNMGRKIGVAGKAAEKGAKGFLALGASALMIGAGVGLAAMGLAKLAASFKDLGDAAWPAALAIGGFTIAFGILMFALMALVTGPQAAVAAGAVTLLLSVGAAALMIGGGIYLATTGIASLVDSMKSLLSLDNAKDSLENFMEVLSPDNILQITLFADALGLIAIQMEKIANAATTISTMQMEFGSPVGTVNAASIKRQFQDESVNRIVSTESTTTNNNTNSQVIKPVVHINGEVKLNDVVLGKFVENIANKQIHKREDVLTGKTLG